MAGQIKNKRASFDYFIEERFEAGLVLTVDPMTARRLRIEGQTQAKEMQRGRHGGKHRLAVI